MITGAALLAKIGINSKKTINIKNKSEMKISASEFQYL